MASPRHIRGFSNGSSRKAPVDPEPLPRKVEAEDDVSDSDSGEDESPPRVPVDDHRFRHDKSILSLVVTSETVYAGTQGGELLVFDLKTYERVRVIEAHAGSVLGLCLSQDGKLLFSGAGDRFVNVWSTETFKNLASIYSVYDVGDIFCVSYSSRLETVYLGAQNTSIQWYDLKDYDTHPLPDRSSHPYLRQDRFFDSLGPGGVRTPRRQSESQPPRDVRRGRDLEIKKSNIYQFAHYGYVYCTLLTKGAVAGVQEEEILLSGGGDGVVKLWRLDETDGGRIHEIAVLDDGREGGESVLSFILEGTFLYTGRVAGEINVWDLETRQLLRSIDAHDEDVLTLAVGRGVLFSAFLDGSVMSFDQRHERVNEWNAHNGRVLASGFVESNGRAIYVTGGNDNNVAVWNVSYTYNAPSSTIKTTHEQMFEALKQFISYRSVSSDPKCRVDCRKAASFLRSMLRQFGASTDLLKTEDGCNPIVLARFRGLNTSQEPRKRLLFYGHYDVISAENRRGKWRSDPFTLSGADGFLYGRGSSDNKGPIMAAIFAVAELISQKALETDIVFLIEGEEERGSKGFKDAVERNKHRIGPIDWILLANSYWLDDEEPCLTYGLRGVLRATVQISSDEPDLHSGVDGSRHLDEPMKDLVMLIARLTGPHGKILIPGFYDSVLPVTENEMALYHHITETILERNPELGSAEELTASLMGRWRDASLTIHSFTSSGPSNSTIIPSVAQTTVSLRLVPNQDLDTIRASLIKCLKSEFAKLQSRNILSVTIDHQAEPWLGDYTNPLFKALEKAIMEVWGRTMTRRRSSVARQPRKSSMTAGGGSKSASRSRKNSTSRPVATTSSTLAVVSATPTSPVATQSPENLSPVFPPSGPPSPSESKVPTWPAEAKAPLRKPLYIREGGSIPAIRFLEKAFDAPAAHLPCGQASDNAHLDNERFRVLNLYNSKEIFRRVFVSVPEL